MRTPKALNDSKESATSRKNKACSIIRSTPFQLLNDQTHKVKQNSLIFQKLVKQYVLIYVLHNFILILI